MYQCNLDKAEPMMGAIGDLDELNAAIGLVLLHEKVHADVCVLKHIQSQLLCLSADLHFGDSRIMERDVKVLEWEIDQRPPVIGTSFTIFGDDERSTYYNFARTVCRRAERSMAIVEKHNPRWVSNLAMEYINKLSSLLFCMSVTRQTISPV